MHYETGAGTGAEQEGRAFARSALKHIHDAPKGLRDRLLKQGGNPALSAALKKERDTPGPLPETATALVAAMQQSVDETREDRRRITRYLDKAPRGDALLHGDTGRKRLCDRPRVPRPVPRPVSLERSMPSLMPVHPVVLLVDPVPSCPCPPSSQRPRGGEGEGRHSSRLPRIHLP